MRRVLGLIVALAIGAGLTACDDSAGDSPDTPSATALSPGPAGDPVRVGPVEWSQSKAGLDVVHDLDVTPRLIASTGFDDSRAVVSLWDRQSGELRWRHDDRTRWPGRTQGISGQQVALGRSSDAAVAVPADLAPGGVPAVAGLAPRDGHVAWTWTPPKSDLVPTLDFAGVAGDFLVVRYGDVAQGAGCTPRTTEVTSVALDLRTGEQVWERPLCVDDVVGGWPVAATDGRPNAVLEPTSGETIWTAEPGATVAGIEDDVVLSGGGGAPEKLTSIRYPDRALPALPDGQPSYAAPQEGPLLVATSDGVLTYTPGDDAPLEVTGLELTSPHQALTVAGRIFVAGSEGVSILGRDGAPLADPVPGELIDAGPDHVELERNGRRIVVPLTD